MNNKLAQRLWSVVLLAVIQPSIAATPDAAKLHLINYLPGLKLFVDSTSPTTPFGMLPFSGEGKPALLVDGYHEGIITPSPAAGTNRQYIKSVIRIRSDGSAKGEISVSLKGTFAVNARSRLRHMQKSQEEEMVKNVLSSMGFLGSGQFEKEDP